MAVFWPDASNQLRQRAAPFPPLRPGDLDDELAIAHFHVGSLANAGADLLREWLGHAQRQAIAPSKT